MMASSPVVRWREEQEPEPERGMPPATLKGRPGVRDAPDGPIPPQPPDPPWTQPNQGRGLAPRQPWGGGANPEEREQIAHIRAWRDPLTRRGVLSFLCSEGSV
jgi:hypothetical protein